MFAAAVLFLFRLGLLLPVVHDAILRVSRAARKNVC